MRLPGTRYQEHGWEQVRKLLGRCSLLAVRRMDLRLLLDGARETEQLDIYTDALAAELRLAQRSARGDAAGNSYGESVSELATSLAFELQAQPSYWSGLAAAIASEHARHGAFWLQAGSEAMLRKKFNDMYAGLRDKVDSDNYQVATGRDCSPNKIYTYRMLDTAYREIEQLFANWQQHREQVAAILGRAAEGIPIEARQMKSIAGCKADWVIRWSESLERFSGSPGPLHTKSKRFSSLKNSPEKIAALMAEIGDYEALSANMGGVEDWRGDEDEAAAWMDDYLRVIAESEAEEEAPLPDVVDQILQPPEAEDEEEEFDLPALESSDGSDSSDGSEEDAEGGAERCASAAASHDAVQLQRDPALAAADEALAASLSLPLRFMELATAAQDGGSRMLQVLNEESLPIRLAVYQKLLGAEDESYPDAWLDPATGGLPTLQQLAALDRISMPTLRKRRNEAIDKLYAMNKGMQT
ncbi:hypothetical protein ASC94_11350 [Massilia sp. Root418]|uniref:hypothetical protein n=1 Tax=Massilia sp. Root418 TaxID=1736532 RepID=UPI0006FBC6A5|nr:hypothetical protein [Massilia sp. Root418]KQW93252.1 hypothetical protein ASC94_11350 [Massilia sp. Root418]